MGTQNTEKSKFLLGMHKQLQTSGFLLSKHHPMRLVICISAEIPAAKMQAKSKEEHVTAKVDLRYPHEKMLERTFPPEQNIRNFFSRKT